MPNMQPIGTLLSKRRQERGLTLDQVAADISVRARVLEAYENTDFDAMPPAGYARATFSSYARYLGLDTRDVMRVYDQQRAEYENRKRAQARADEDWRRRADRGFDAGSDAYGRSAHSSQDGATRRDVRGGSRAEQARTGSGRPVRPYSTGYGSSEREYRGSYETRTSSPASGQRVSADGMGRRPSYRATAPENTTASARRPGGPSAQGAYRSERQTGRPDGGYGQYGQHEAAGARSGQQLGVGTAREAHGYGTSSHGHRGMAEQPAGGQLRPRAGAAYERSEWREREQVEPVGPDDGYEGGSGGRAGSRNQTRLGGQQDLREVLLGVLDAIKADRRALLVVVAACVVVVAVVLAVVVNAIVNRPQAVVEETPVQKTDVTQLKPSGLDLNSIPVNSQVVLTLSADSASAVWAEVNVDGTAVFADNLQAGVSNTWTVGKSITMTLSDLTGVQVTINGTEVTPTISNGTYTLTANVPQDQWVQEPAAQEGQDGAPADDTASSQEPQDYSDGSDYSDDSGDYDSYGYYE